MSFHPRKVLAHLSVNSIRVHLQNLEPDLADDFDWGRPEKEVRDQIEQWLLTDGARRADHIATLQRVFHMANEAGDRAMIAACGSDVTDSGVSIGAGTGPRIGLQ
ncbi:MAG: hypothetical protein U1E45_04970 [Geminicoccaceae bacterium]